MTITPRQREVIEKMRDGWELIRQTYPPYAVWLAKKGDFARVHAAIFEGLFRNGLIASNQRERPIVTYTLTPADREAVEK